MARPTNPIGSRREARESALAILYAAESRGEELLEVLATQPVPPDGYVIEIVEGLAGVLVEVDDIIGRFAEGWRTDRMPAVDRALLRMAVYELGYRPDVPTSAVLAEVVELAGDYSTERSARFVNGVVSGIADELRPSEADPA
tara:strand:+ start:2379 stop:2807 length:429 start_codon:yes stop_codon:yes gene_type:complete